MALQLQLEKKNYRQWVKAGLGLGYLKEGLVPFCNDIADQQHKDILQNIRSTKSLPSTATCGSCQVDTLKPDHKPAGNAGNKVCPLGQVRCSCCFTKGKTACPNNICGAIYDFIVQNHASSPPSPNWKNSDAQQWSTDPWSICKCFINSPGYEQTQSASETDCTGLLHLLINNQYFHSHIACDFTVTNNLFSKVRQYRNDIFHSSNMELEESEANSYIDKMIKVLKDGKELFQRSDAQIALKKLEDLKEKDFIITTEGFEEVLRQIKAEMGNAPTKEEYEDLKTQMSKLKEEIKRLQVEDSPEQKQLEYEKAKSEWQKKLIEQYHKTLLQVPTLPLQPKSKKCSFNEIYIRPQIIREMKEEKGEIKEVEVKTMSEMFTYNGVPHKSVYVLGDAGSGKTSFCKYLVNCWCLAQSGEHEADSENEEHGCRNAKHGGDNEEHVDDNEEHGGNNEGYGRDNEGHVGDNEEHGVDNEEHGGDNEEHGGDNEEHGVDNEEHGSDNEEHVDDNEEHVDNNEEHGGDNEEHVHDNEEHGGNNEEHGGDNEEHGGDNEEHVDDNEEHGGNNEEHGGDNEEHGVDNEEHGSDNEEHVDDNAEHGGDNEEHVDNNEEHGGDNEEHGSDNEEHVDDNEEHVGDNEEHVDDNKEHGGDNEEHGGDNEEHVDDNEEHGGNNEDYGGDNEGHVGDNEEHGVDNEEHGSDNEEHVDDNEEHGGDKEEHVGDNEEHVDNNEEHGDDNEEHVGDNEEHVDDNKEHGGDNEEHGGDNEEHVDDNENKGDNKNEEHEGGNEKHTGDNEEHGDDNKKHENDKESEDSSGKYGNDGKSEGCNDKHGGDNEEHEKHGDGNENEGGDEKHKEHESDIVNEEHGGVIENEKHMGDIMKRGSDSDDIQDESYDVTNSELYSDDSDGYLTASEFKSDDSEYDNNIYEYQFTDEYEITDMEFKSDDSEYDSKSYELKFNGVKEMKKFEFLFYIPLRQYQNIDTIDEMLQKRYQMKMLNTLLEEESFRVMILLDGLDEWSSENVPEHSIFKEYTIVTTSRPWKFHTLRSSDVEIEQPLKLKGFDFKCEREMVYRTVSLLNVRRHGNKEARDCRKKLKEKSLKSLKQVPIMLQQLICLWFDGKLDKISRCAISTGMLELIFTWNDMKTTGTNTRLMTGTKKVILPQYLADKTKLRLNCHFIYEVSILAFETLFNCPMNKSLTFDICMFDELEISDEVRENCLKLGIITEDECLSLSVSEPPSSLFSFIHKSMQEFLAAVNISINFNTKIGSSGSTGNVELTKKFINEVFQKCSTVNDILEQSNVVIMLCGLEPRLATHVSKYIYDTVSEDTSVQEYRRTLSCDTYMVDNCITDIQKLIIELIEESNAACSEGSNPVFYIGDLTIDICNQYCDIVCSSIDQHQILPDSVLSIDVLYINTKNVRFTKYLPMFHHLEKIVITLDRSFSTQSFGSQRFDEIDEINNCLSETIKVNTLTLKSLSLYNFSNTNIHYPVNKTVVSNLPSMVNLVAISMSFITMSHDDTTTFCNFLEGTTHLEQLYLGNVYCECHNQHDVNLSKHQQLHYLYLKYTVRVIDVDTTNLEIFVFSYLKDRNYEKTFDIIKKSYKLKQLVLYGDKLSKSQLYHANITERLVRVLPLFHNLSKLQLYYCTFTDNIIQLPLEMKSLKDIKLADVIMSLTTWQKFVDSLPSIPHTVDVSVNFCYITGDGEECNDDMLTLTFQGLKGGEGNDAIQYLKDQKLSFHVKSDDRIFFNFSTKR